MATGGRLTTMGWAAGVGAGVAVGGGTSVGATATSVVATTFTNPAMPWMPGEPWKAQKYWKRPTSLKVNWKVCALFITPEHTVSWWPWALTPLTGRATGAWAFSLGVAAVHALWENDVARVRPAAFAYAAFAVLETVSVLRFADDGDWSSASGIVYLAFLASSAVVGVATIWLAWGEDEELGLSSRSRGRG